MTSTTEGKGPTDAEAYEAAEALKKKSLSKFGPFNQSILATSKGIDSDEEYGILVPEESDDVKFNKKSLSKFASTSVDNTLPKKIDDDDDYGSFDPSFKLEKVAHTSKGELIVVPENLTPKTIKKTLSKYGTPSSVQKTPASVRSADSDDDFGVLSNGQPKMIKKTLSKNSPKSSMNKLETKLSYDDIKIDSDEEEYGEVDPNFKPVPVAVTSSGHFVVPPEPVSDKKIKKTLSKYKDPSMSAEKPPLASSSTAVADVLKSRDSDEEYGNDIDTSYLDSVRAKSRKTSVNQTNSASKSNSISQSHSISVSKSRSDDTAFSNGEVSTEHLAPVKALVAKIEKNKVNH